MPRYKVLDKQTRERLGELEAENQSGALRMAQQEYGEDGARYVEVTLLDRPTGYRPPGFVLSHAEVQEAVMYWARHVKQVPDGYAVRLWVPGLPNDPCVVGQVVDTTIEPPVDDDEPDEQVEGFAPGEAPEGGGQGGLMVPIELAVQSSPVRGRKRAKY